MSATAFVPGRRVVQRGDRRFVCGPPTLGTVVRLSALFGQELDAAMEAYGSGDEVATSSAFVRFTRAGGPAAAVLSTCCDLEGGSPEDLEAAVSADGALAAVLALAVLELANLGAIKDRLSETSGRSGAPDPDAPDSWSFSACLLGEWFGCSPFDVFGWPFEAVLEALHTTRSIKEKRLGADSSAGAWRKSVSVAGLGVGTAQIRGRKVVPMRRRDG